jgi:hypothetical protein
VAIAGRQWRFLITAPPHPVSRVTEPFAFANAAGALAQQTTQVNDPADY